MKFLLLAIMIFCGGLRAAVAAETADPLERQIANTCPCKTFDDFMNQIREKTGFKVTYPEAVATLYHQIDGEWDRWKSGKIEGPWCMVWVYSHDEEEEKEIKADPDYRKNVSIKEWMDAVCMELRLAWKFDPGKRVFTLDLPWKKSDPRTAAELLDYVCKHRPLEEFSERSEWLSAFDALLSKDTNLAKATRARQFSFNIFGRNKVMFAGEISAASKTRYTFILIDHPSYMRPGCSLTSYYWFKADGSLAGTGLFSVTSSIHLLDVKVVDAAVPGGIDLPGVRIAYGDGLQKEASIIARFTLEDTGLKLTHLTDMRGEKITDGWGIGRPYLPPEGK